MLLSLGRSAGEELMHCCRALHLETWWAGTDKNKKQKAPKETNSSVHYNFLN